MNILVRLGIANPFAASDKFLRWLKNKRYDPFDLNFCGVVKK